MTFRALLALIMFLGTALAGGMAVAHDGAAGAHALTHHQLAADHAAGPACQGDEDPNGGAPHGAGAGHCCAAGCVTGVSASPLAGFGLRQPDRHLIPGDIVPPGAISDAPFRPPRLPA